MRNRYVIATIKSWNINNFERLAGRFRQDEFILIKDKDELTLERLRKAAPRYVFFPHWSWVIPKVIYEGFECVVFHMTDLPFGRGGSPLQNLLERGIYHTKITAIRAGAGMDTGDVYFKEDLDIGTGSADDILSRASDIIFEKMIPRLAAEHPAPVPQKGEPTVFKRRTPEQSEIPDGLSQRQVYDYIRMLDGEGYPAAYVRKGTGKIFFTNARHENGIVSAEARFEKGGDV